MKYQYGNAIVLFLILFLIVGCGEMAFLSTATPLEDTEQGKQKLTLSEEDQPDTNEVSKAASSGQNAKGQESIVVHSNNKNFPSNKKVISNNQLEVFCHIPPGNPENKKSMQLPPAAVKSHLAHGDALGECP